MRHLLTALALIGAIFGGPLFAQEERVVVELYTSQGCSSCPPADALLDELAKRNEVIALALHVDYWDYLGWKDTFSSAEFSARQNGYARAANSRTVYTPQMIIGGVDHVVGSKTMEVMDRVAQRRDAENLVGLKVVRNLETLEIEAEPRRAGLGNMVVQVVRYEPIETVDIKRGENAGKSVRYVNIVTAWDLIGPWDGVGTMKMIAPVAGDAPVVVIVQKVGFGPIVAAVELR
tara:strand:- start:11519 stop:12217 length:699 start_codon:yes stop_codon:yes gene_type:complete